MTTGAQLRQLLHRAYFGPAWHGPAVAELLADVTAAQAAAPPKAGSHSIWQLVAHMTAWRDEVRRRLHGPGRKLTEGENWPTIDDASEAAWQAMLERSHTSQRALEEDVAGFSDEQLTAAADNLPGGREELLHVVIHHDLYHAGQIALLKAAVGR
jgi:uncharacterized damage-inducible protein DinB